MTTYADIEDDGKQEKFWLFLSLENKILEKEFQDLFHLYFVFSSFAVLSLYLLKFLALCNIIIGSSWIVIFLDEQLFLNIWFLNLVMYSQGLIENILM